MDFIQELRTDYDNRVAPRVLARNAARDVVAGIRRQIEAEETAQQEHEQKINTLEEGIGAALVEGSEAYAKIEIALENARAEEGRCAQRLEKLRAMLPHKQEELVTAERRLNEQRTLLARENLAIVQVEIDRHVGAILDAYDGWIVSHLKLAGEVGDGFVPPLDSRPEIKHDRIGKQFMGLIQELPQTEYAERARQQDEKSKKT